MLTQLNRLCLEIDGRYARSDELDFVKSYLQSTDLRLNVYQKLCTHAPEIIAKTEEKMKVMDKRIFFNSEHDFTEVWEKDIEMLLRYAAAAVLFNDPDHLREGLLLWHNTIAKSYKFDHTCDVTFNTMPEIVKEYLTEEEVKLFLPIVQMNKIFLVE
jgi:hypothetical protein